MTVAQTTLQIKWAAVCVSVKLIFGLQTYSWDQIMHRDLLTTKTSEPTKTHSFQQFLVWRHY